MCQCLMNSVAKKEEKKNLKMIFRSAELNSKDKQPI